jgi:hypothetical protein
MKSVKKEPVDKPGTGGRNLIGHFQKVAQTLEKSGLDPATVKKISGSISIIRSFLGCTADQAMLFSVIFILNFRQQAVTFSDMAEFLECSEFDIVRYLPDLEDLVRRRLLRTERDRSNRRSMLSEISYFVTRDILDAVFIGRKARVKDKSPVTAADLLLQFREMAGEQEENRLTFDELSEDVLVQVENNSELDLAGKLRKEKFDIHDLMLFLHVCTETMEGKDEVDLDNACNSLFENSAVKFDVKRSLIRGNSQLIIKGLIKLQDGCFRSDREVLLTEKAAGVPTSSHRNAPKISCRYVLLQRSIKSF